MLGLGGVTCLSKEVWHDWAIGHGGATCERVEVLRSDRERTKKKQSGIGIRQWVRVRIEKSILKLGLGLQVLVCYIYIYLCKLSISGADINNLISDPELDFSCRRKPKPNPDQPGFFPSKLGWVSQVWVLLSCLIRQDKSFSLYIYGNKLIYIRYMYVCMYVY